MCHRRKMRSQNVMRSIHHRVSVSISHSLSVDLIRSQLHRQRHCMRRILQMWPHGMITHIFHDTSQEIEKNVVHICLYWSTMLTKGSMIEMKHRIIY